MSDWRLIKTAPKMKTLLLFAWTEMVDEPSHLRNWRMGTGFWHRGYEEWEWEGRILKPYDWQPTHWMPLPEPPP